MAGQRAWDVRAADHDQPGSERAKASFLDLLHTPDGLTGVQSTHRRPIQQAIESCLGGRPQVLTLAARKIQAGQSQAVPDQGPGTRVHKRDHAWPAITWAKRAWRHVSLSISAIRSMPNRNSGPDVSALP